MNIVPGSPWIRDVRTVSMDVFNQPDLFTPKGRDPIKPRRIEIRYDIRTAEVGGITVNGERVNDTGHVRRWGYRRTVSRRITDLQTAPEWVREIVDAYRPVVPEVVDWLDGFDPVDGNDLYSEAMRLRAGLAGQQR